MPTSAPLDHPLIELRQVTKTYNSGVPVTALGKTDLIIREGESIAVVGPSGSGKSTLLNMLGLLDSPTSGNYLFNGVDVSRSDELVLGAVRGQRFGFVFQSFHLLPNRTVTENVEVAMMYARVPGRERRERAQNALNTLGLLHRREADPRDLSGGERQRAAIARAICLEPQVLFCDEPTGNLDSRNTEIVMDSLARLNRAGQTLVMVTHDPDLAALLDRTISVKDGVVSEGSPDWQEVLGMRDSGKEILSDLGLVTSRLTLTDLIKESWYSVMRNFGRSLVAALGALLGCAAFVGTLGISGTAGSQISESFDVRRATEVSVTARKSADATPDSGDEENGVWYTAGAVKELDTIAGVVQAGRITTVRSLDVRRFLISSEDGVRLDAYAVDAGVLDTIELTLTAGRTFDDGHVLRKDPVVLISLSVATQLGISQPGSAIFIGDLGLTVIGIYDDVQRVPGAAAGIIVPISLEESSSMSHGQVPSRQILIQTLPGAAIQASHQVPLVVSPADPEAVLVSAPPDPQTLRREVEDNVMQLSLLVSLVALVLGAISIGNATAMGVVLRTPEIGLRRALGARRRDIFLQLLGETSALGLLGGVAGTAVGVVLTVAISGANRWVPVLDPRIAFLAIIAGALTGMMAGVLPAYRATRIAPAYALSR